MSNLTFSGLFFASERRLQESSTAFNDDYLKILYFILFLPENGEVSGRPHINGCLVYKENIFLGGI